MAIAKDDPGEVHGTPTNAATASTTDRADDFIADLNLCAGLTMGLYCSIHTRVVQLSDVLVREVFFKAGILARDN